MSHQLSKHDVGRRTAGAVVNQSRLTAGRRKHADGADEAGCAAGIRNVDES